MRQVLPLYALALAACMIGEPDADPPITLQPDTVTSFTGTIGANGWLTKQVTVPSPSTLSATLDWSNAGVDLNLFVKDAAGTTIVFANTTTAKPEHVTASNLAAGTYTVAIKNKNTTTSTAYTLSVTITPNFTSHYPAQPHPGTVFWGAAISGNGDPVTRDEQPSGHPLSLHRTYWQWTQRTTGLVSQASDDLAHHRLPWVSIKPPPPPSWADMGAGVYDAQIDQLLNALKALPGPVWLTVHHEPEGGGSAGNTPDDPAGPSGHIAMNRRVRQRMTALGVHNVALAPILMSYTFKPASGRDPEAWWAPGIYDFFGVDHYVYSETPLTDATWQVIRTWAAGKGVDVAVGEWGTRGTDAQAGQNVKAWYEAAIASQSDGHGARMVGLSAFDSNLNSSGTGWELMGAQLTTFLNLLGDPRTASVDHP